MKDFEAYYFIVVILVALGVGIYFHEPNKVCIDSEMQYYQANCIDHNGHKVCKADEAFIYFNFTMGENLTETVIDSLAEKL